MSINRPSETARSGVGLMGPIGLLLLALSVPPPNALADDSRPVTLNNLVIEIINARDQRLLRQPSITFTVRQTGWFLVAVEGPASLRLNDEIKPLCHGQSAGESTEAMRHLALGTHRLLVTGRPSQVIVRRIPILQHAFYNAGDMWNLDHGPFDDWQYLKRHVLDNINVIISGGAGTPHGFAESQEKKIRWISNPEGTAHYAREDHLREWKSRGRHWLTSAINPFRTRNDVSADEAYRTWSRAVGLKHPLLDGVVIDEFGGGDQPKYAGFAKAVKRIYAEPAFRGKTYSPYSYGSGILSNDLSRSFARASARGGGQVCIERYLVEQPTRAEAIRHIHRQLHAEWNMPRYKQDWRDVVKHTVMALGYMSAVGESLNVHPDVDFKVHMDLQMQALATSPDYAGLAGLQWYTCSYADDETMRWASRLFRHYAIEGQTQLLSDKLGYRYHLAHIRNPDFADGTNGWDARSAIAGSLTTKSHPQYGYLQFRYNRVPLGNTFLWTKRHASRPNTVSQEIRHLVPGRLYSLKLVTADHGDLIAERQSRKAHAVSIAIGGAELLPGKKMSFQSVFTNHYSRPVGNFRGNHSFYMNYHWKVFRATRPTARLTISDWKAPESPGGPIGQELMFNFVEVQPFYADEAPAARARR